MEGPFSSTLQSPPGDSPYGMGYRYPGCKKIFRTWYRQPKPRVNPLPFDFSLAEVTTGFEMTVDSLGSRADSSILTDATNKCYSRLIGKIHADGNAALAVTLAEHKQATSMIANRAMQLVHFTLAAKQGRLKDAAHLLGLTPGQYLKTIKARGGKRKAKEYMKTPANAWLEWHFGVDPLIEDLKSAVTVLSGGPRPVKVTASASAYSSGRWSQGPYWGWLESVTHTTLAKARMGCYVKVSNPNLAMANELGLINLANVALELVPWSFVVGWFVNYAEVLSSYTDLLGYDIYRAYTTTSIATTEDYLKSYVYNDTEAPKFGGGKTISVQRRPGITTPVLTLRFKQVSVTRGVTAIALLTQML